MADRGERRQQSLAVRLKVARGTLPHYDYYHGPGEGKAWLGGEQSSKRKREWSRWRAEGVWSSTVVVEEGEERKGRRAGA